MCRCKHYILICFRIIKASICRPDIFRTVNNTVISEITTIYYIDRPACCTIGHWDLLCSRGLIVFRSISWITIDTVSLTVIQTDVSRTGHIRGTGLITIYTCTSAINILHGKFQRIDLLYTAQAIHDTVYFTILYCNINGIPIIFASPTDKWTFGTTSHDRPGTDTTLNLYRCMSINAWRIGAIYICKGSASAQDL